MERETKCKAMESRLAEMLLAPESASAEVREHVNGCPACAKELGELRAAMGVLDQWQAPEPNPYFLTRMEASLREARLEPRRGLLGRWIDRMQMSARPQPRPVAAMALTLALLLGGGAYLGVSAWDQPKPQPEQTAVVHDLQNMDSNAQLLDQLEQMGSNDDNQPQQP